MSSSMWAWRVVVPVLGLAACSVVFWRTWGVIPTALTSSIVPPAISSPSRVVAEGRVVARPGAEVTVGTEVGGLVVRLAVQEKARVARGDLLVELRSDDEKAAVLEAEARLAEVDSEVGFLTRKTQLYNKNPSTGMLFQIEVDDARHNLEVSLTRRRGAVAGLDRARLAVARRRITSPIDGVVIACPIRLGEIAMPGSPLVIVCDLDKVWIEAEVDDFDIGRVAVGDFVRIKAEGDGSNSWPGTVEEIPDRVAARSLRPEDPGRPSETRVLLVKIATNAPLGLKLGQQVEVEIGGKRP